MKTITSIVTKEDNFSMIRASSGIKINPEINEEICNSFGEILNNKFPANPLPQATKTIINEAPIYATEIQPIQTEKFNGNFLRLEKEEKNCHTYEKPIQYNISEIETFPTFKEYLLKEINNMNIVYEKLYPNSISNLKRTNLFFSELVNLYKKRKIQMENKYPEIFEKEKGLPYYKIKGNDDETLIFESRFECGNLCLVAKILENEYDLYLNNDINTRGYIQWFMFEVSNTRESKTVTFNIKNFSKLDSLFNYGMRPMVYSKIENKICGLNWHRGCEKIRYYPIKVKKGLRKPRCLYSLSFTYTFQYSSDKVYFSYCYPYSYSDLTNYLNTIVLDEERSKYIYRRTLCRTLAGNRCEYVTITNKSKIEERKNKKGVCLSARVHPGETVSSWVMQGILEILTDPNNKEAEALRKHFIFKIIPMLNPDGVLHGNYRCTLAGSDPNRKWKKTNKITFPTIHYAKLLFKRLHNDRGVSFFCDLHGHSRKKDCFMYGCEKRNFPESSRIFPYIMSKICHHFSYSKCRFGQHHTMEGTSRISLWRDFKIPSIYTLESSFCGTTDGKLFTVDDLKQIGYDLLKALIVYSEIEVNQTIPLCIKLIESNKT